jgi:hypothetical protein
MLALHNYVQLTGFDMSGLMGEREMGSILNSTLNTQHSTLSKNRASLPVGCPFVNPLGLDRSTPAVTRAIASLAARQPDRNTNSPCKTAQSRAS